MTHTYGKRIRWDRIVVNDDYRAPVPPSTPQWGRLAVTLVVSTALAWFVIYVF